MKKIINKLRSSSVGIFARREYWRCRGKYEMKKYDDHTFICKKYRTLGREINLENPKRYTEKLQWLKLFYRNDLMPVCSDKYEVRAYLTEKGYEYLLNDLIAVYENVDDFDPEILPDQFVLKASHGSGWNLIVKDKSKVNWFLWKRIMRSWLEQNLYWFGREWNYDKLSPRIIVEKYIDSGDGQLTDYKFFCFNGVVEFIQVDRDRFLEHKQTYFDTEWNKLAFSTGHAHFDEGCPKSFDEMKRIAEELSKPFPHVRVDFYHINGKIYFGEFTFFDGSGFYSYEPDEWDFHWGEKLKLPKPNFNQDLHESIQ